MAIQQPLPKNKILVAPPVLRFQEEEVPNIFFTSDLHIEHKNILEFTKRKEIFSDVTDMNRRLLEMVNDPVLHPQSDTKKLILVHCGDLLFGQRSLSQSNYKMIQEGLSKYDRVYAVAGNHDRNNIMMQHKLIMSYSGNITDGTECNTKWFWNNMFIVEIYRGAKCISVFTVSHFPMTEFHGAFNIHGHLHSFPGFEPDTESHKTWEGWLSTGVHFDCGVDNNNYKPVCLCDILSGKTSVKIDKIPQLAGIKFSFNNAAETAE